MATRKEHRPLNDKYRSSGWLEDDLDCVNRITDDVFTLDDIYTFEEEL